MNIRIADIDFLGHYVHPRALEPGEYEVVIQPETATSPVVATLRRVET